MSDPVRRIPTLPLALGLAAALLLSLVCGVAFGASGIELRDVLRLSGAGLTGGRLAATDAAAYAIVWEIRLPRTLLAAVVAVSGAIGFVGLLMPHLARMLVGAGHRRVLVIAPLAGALLLVWVDIASRTLLAPAELPVGVFTAVLGVPAFLLMMRRRGQAFGGRR